MKKEAEKLDGRKHNAKLAKVLENAAITQKLHRGQLQDQILHK